MSLFTFLHHSLNFSFQPEKCVQKVQKKHGDPFYLQLTPKAGVWVGGNSEAAKSIFTAPYNTFAKLEPSDPIKIITGPKTLILAGGEHHLYQKQAMTPIFRGENMRLYSKIMHEQTLSEIQTWYPGEKLNLFNTMKNITMKVILSVVFGLDHDDQFFKFSHQGFDLLNAYTPPIMFIPALRKRYWRPWTNFLNKRNAFDELLLEKIYSARKTQVNEKQDILSKFAQLVLADGKQWSELELLDHLRTLLIAGHDTASIALTWVLSFVYSHKTIQQNLWEELKPFEHDFSFEDIIKLPYLTAVCKEALRIHPAVPIIMRTLDKPFNYLGKQLNAGDNVGLSITLLHSQPNIWEKPLEFLPQRFLQKIHSNYDFVPFGGGTKRCLGAAFAMHEMKIVLATLLLKSNLSISHWKNQSPKLHGLTMCPRKPIYVIA